jgi:hypothetical protein
MHRGFIGVRRIEAVTSDAVQTKTDALASLIFCAFEKPANRIGNCKAEDSNP